MQVSVDRQVPQHALVLLVLMLRVSAAPVGVRSLEPPTHYRYQWLRSALRSLKSSPANTTSNSRDDSDDDSDDDDNPQNNHNHLPTTQHHSLSGGAIAGIVIGIRKSNPRLSALTCFIRASSNSPVGPVMVLSILEEEVPSQATISRY